MPCIYIFTSPSGKSYVGQTAHSFLTRKRKHVSNAENGSLLPFHRAIRMYGIENFQEEIIECLEHELNLFERFFIGVFKGLGKVYNCTDGGEGNLGWHPSEETKRKIGLASIGRKATLGWHHTLESKAKLSAHRKGKQLSEEHRAKVIKSLIGRKPSNETRKKLSLAKMGNPSNTGKKLSLEVRQKMSLAANAYWKAKKNNGGSF